MIVELLYPVLKPTAEMDGSFWGKQIISILTEREMGRMEAMKIEKKDKDEVLEG